MNTQREKPRRVGALVAFVVALGCFGAMSSAGAAELWVDEYLLSVYPLSDGNFILSFQTAPTQCTSTANPKYFHVYAGQNGVTAEGVKAMLAASLTALASGKRVQAAFDDSTSNCFVNRIRIVS